MKLVIVTALTLVSSISVAMADGFRCQNNTLRAKLFNETQPGRGTRNPAVLVVSERDVGTLATLEGDEIVKTNGEFVVTYEGQANSRQNGRFVAVKLEIEKQAEKDGIFAGLHLAKLLVNADGENREATLTCERYLKAERQ
ncbi:MAG: hypothetical protein HY074_20465 [Deltaproteobacteria bacterium]|nr:hypothetical protein [Deltaproteobacteria bacterium]